MIQILQKYEHQITAVSKKIESLLKKEKLLPMSIDYKLREGICQNRNATYLMKKMGILIDKS